MIFKRRYIPPLKRSDFSFEQTCGPLTQRCVMHSLIISFPVIPEKKILISRQCIFTFLRYYLPSENDVVLHLENFIQRCFVPRLFELRGSGKEDFQIFPHNMYLPLIRVVALHMIKFESPFTQG